jgi:hypothetical protein
MDLNDVYKYAYIKKPLNEHFQSPADVPFEFLLEWFKDTFDYQRIHSEEEMREFIKLNPEDILRWLEDAVRLTWESKKEYLDKEFISSKDILNGK